MAMPYGKPTEGTERPDRIHLLNNANANPREGTVSPSPSIIRCSHFTSLSITVKFNATVRVFLNKFLDAVW